MVSGALHRIDSISAIDAMFSQGYLSALGAENLAELADLADMQPVHATRLGLFAEKALM